MKKFKKIFLPIVIIIVAIVLASCNATTPDDADVTPVTGSATPAIESSTPENGPAAYFSKTELSYGIDDYYYDLEDYSILPSDLPEVFVIATINDASASTVVSCKWLYLGQDPAMLIVEKQLSPEAGQSTINFSATAPTEGWALGNYSVELYINAQLQQTLNFEFQGMGY